MGTFETRDSVVTSVGGCSHHADGVDVSDLEAYVEDISDKTPVGESDQTDSWDHGGDFSSSIKPAELAATTIAARPAASNSGGDVPSAPIVKVLPGVCPSFGSSNRQ